MRRKPTVCFSVALANVLATSAADPAPRVDKVVVEKTRRRLVLLDNRRIVRSYRISLGGNPAGPKERRSDRRTPEGSYVVAGRNPKSPNHLALRLARQSPSSPEHAGGGLQLHGTPDWLGPLAAALKGSDWTTGGIAVANADIEEIWNLVPDGTPVVIRP